MEIRERIRKETDRENVSERTLSAAQRGDGREGEHEADRRAGGWGGVEEERNREPEGQREKMLRGGNVFMCQRGRSSRYLAASKN